MKSKSDCRHGAESALASEASRHRWLSCGSNPFRRQSRGAGLDSRATATFHPKIAADCRAIGVDHGAIHSCREAIENSFRTTAPYSRKTAGRFQTTGTEFRKTGIHFRMTARGSRTIALDSRTSPGDSRTTALHSRTAVRCPGRPSRIKARLSAGPARLSAIPPRLFRISGRTRGTCR